MLNHLSQYAGCHRDIPQFKLVPDSSISGHSPAECVTPALNGSRDGFKALKSCCDSLTEAGASVNVSCGLHVHIGAENITDEHYINVFKNYQMLEDAIDSIVSASRRNSRWCRSIRNYDFSDCTTKDDVFETLGGDRYRKVNPVAYVAHRTIEFRQHQGTVSYTKIRKWVNFLAKLVAWSEKNVLTAPVSDINEVPFLTDAERSYFTGRRDALRTA